jgi:hypothetical protein
MARQVSNRDEEKSPMPRIKISVNDLITAQVIAGQTDDILPAPGAK